MHLECRLGPGAEGDVSLDRLGAAESVSDLGRRRLRQGFSVSEKEGSIEGAQLTALPSPSPTSVEVRRKYFGASLTRKTMSTSSFSLNTLSLRSKLASIPR